MREFAKKIVVYAISLTLLIGIAGFTITENVGAADNFDGDVIDNPWGDLFNNDNKPGDLVIDDPGNSQETVTIKSKELKISVKSASKKKNAKKAKIVLSNKKIKSNLRKKAKYQIKYATNKKMKKAKTKTLKKTRITLKKLKPKKKYYIRVRAFVKNTNGKNVYGKWTKAKKIKLK